jgi:hypothetical protein
MVCGRSGGRALDGQALAARELDGRIQAETSATTLGSLSKSLGPSPAVRCGLLTLSLVLAQATA